MELLYVVDVEILEPPGGGPAIAKRKFLVSASNPIDAQKTVFNTIGETFGGKKIGKVCTSCEEVDLWQ